MNKNCLQYNNKMKLIPNSGKEIGNYKIGNLFQNEILTGIGAEYYACPNCGFVQQYITEDSLHKLKKL